MKETIIRLLAVLCLCALSLADTPKTIGDFHNQWFWERPPEGKSWPHLS